MAVAGDSIPKLIALQVADGLSAGDGLSYANKTAFQAAGWNLTWCDADGVALTSQPTWTIAVEDATRGIHRVKAVLPSGIGYVKPTIPSGYRIDPARWPFEGQAYDDDAIAGLLQTNQGVPEVRSADDGDLGDVVMGDSWSTGTLTIAAGKLTPFGYVAADLASGWTISGGFRTAPNAPSTAVLSGVAAGNGITAEFVSAVDGTFRVKWTVSPTAMALGTTAEAQVWYLDVQIKKTSSSEIITVARYRLRFVWQRDTTT